jgi:hypothetical protein
MKYINTNKMIYLVQDVPKRLLKSTTSPPSEIEQYKLAHAQTRKRTQPLIMNAKI